MKNGELSFACQNYEDAIVFLEKALYLLELDQNVHDDHPKYRCLYTLFLSYAELGSTEMMVFVGEKTSEILRHKLRRCMHCLKMIIIFISPYVLIGRILQITIEAAVFMREKLKNILIEL